MPDAAVLDLVVRYRKGQTYGVHALLAALEVEPPPVPYELHLARTADQVAERVRDGVARGRRVLTVWSFYSPDAAVAGAELAQVRAAAPGEGVLHVAGGVHATAEPLATLRSGFDLLVTGEGEAAFTRLVAALATGADADALPGTAWLDRSTDPAGVLRRAEPAQRHPLDRYPSFPFTRNLTGPIEITRGCIYACQFCQTPFMFSARFRHRGVDSVRAHVRAMRQRGLKDVRFITPTSLSYGSADGGVNLDAVAELLGAVQAELLPNGRIFFGSFPSEVRPEHVTPAALRLLRRYVANDNLIIGGQSGSEDMLRRSHRGHGVEVIEAAVRIAVEVGFRPNVDVIFGMPGESEDEAMATVALAERLAGLGATIHGHAFMPLPGTPWRDEQPAPLSTACVAALQRLSSQGRIYGSWQRQRGIAADLAGSRSAESGHRIRRVAAARRGPGGASGAGPAATALGLAASGVAASGPPASAPAAFGPAAPDA